MLNRKVMGIVLTVGLMKKTYYKMNYVPTYSELEEEIVSVTLNVSNYVTQKKFKNVTKIDTSDFTLKTHVSQIKKKLDDIDVDKINNIDELQGKNLFEQNYLLFNSAYKYLKVVIDSTKTLTMLIIDSQMG